MHSGGDMKKTIKERFEEKFIPEPNSGCWLWTGCVRSHPSQGYGILCIGNKKEDKAHRISYKLYKGIIPENMVVRHKCDNRLCVNPDHLELGTPLDNIKDRVERGRCAKGEKNGSSKLFENQVIAIFKDNRSITEIAKEYNIGHTAVSYIKLRKSWAWLTENIVDEGCSMGYARGERVAGSKLKQQEVIAIFKDNRDYEIIERSEEHTSELQSH